MIPLIVSGVMAAGAAAQSRRQAKKERRLLEQQEAEERHRTQQIEGTQAVINSLFDSPQRQANYQRFLQALRERYGTMLDRQHTDAARNAKFTLARSGLVGGSVDRDVQRGLGEELAEGTLRAEREARGALRDLQGQDEQARQALIDFAARGLDATTAMRRGQAQLQSNLQAARADAGPAALGDIFSRTAGTYRSIAERQARRQGFGHQANRQDLYG